MLEPLALALTLLVAPSEDLVEELQDYSARFADEAVEVTGLRGGGAATSLIVRAIGVGRGAALAEMPVVERRSRDAAVVTYHRGALQETYELREDGVKQSFVFHERPAGIGDLVVRLALHTDLRVAEASAAELLLGDGERGGLRIGAVVGYDAVGQRTKGELRLGAAGLDLVLPAEFVDRAVLPLTLDPLIGPPATVTTYEGPAPTTVSRVDVANLAATGQYFAVWEQLSSIDPSVFGQRLSASGAPSGAPIDFLSGVPSSFFFWRPAVVAVEGAGRFVVAMNGGDDVAPTNQPYFASVDSSGALTTAISPPLWGETGFIALAGDTSPTHGSAFAATIPDRQFFLLEVDAASCSVVDATFFTVPTSADRDPSLPANGGDAGRYLVVWTRLGDTLGAIFDRDLTILVPEFVVSSGPEQDSLPAVDGDGSSWLVAFERRASGGSADIVCRTVTYDPASGGVELSVERNLHEDPGVDEVDPSVAWTGDSYLVGHSEQFSGNDYDVFVTSVDAHGCRPCEGEFTVASPATTERRVRIAAQGASGSRDEALLLWPENTGVALGFGFEHLLRQRRFRADDGHSIDLGGSCGPAGPGAGGVADATCVRPGATNFGVRLREAEPGVPAVLALATRTLNLACGGCTLVPDLQMLVPTVTSANGTAQVTLALPPTVVTAGSVFFAQWIVAVPGPCPAIQLSFSNALEIQAQ